MPVHLEMEWQKLIDGLGVLPCSAIHSHLVHAYILNKKPVHGSWRAPVPIPPRGRPHRPSERYPIVSSVFSASQRTGSLITNQTIEHVDAQQNQSIIGNR